MDVPVKMPSLGETMTDGTVNQWYYAVGDTVTEGEPLLEVGTDKVDTDVAAPASGTLIEILVPADETVQVGVDLAVIRKEP